MAIVAENVLYFLKQLILVFLNVVNVAMFARAIFSWFDPMQETKLSAFLYTVTEPLILPFRALFRRLNWFQGSPLDMSFMFTLLAIILLEMMVNML